MKINSFTLINTWNSISYIFKSLVDDDRSSTIAARRMKLSSIKSYEDKTVQKQLNLKDGDRIEAPYNIIVPSNHENENNSYIHLYLIEDMDDDIGKTAAINDFFYDQYQICMIFLNKKLFTLDSSDVGKVTDSYYFLFDSIIHFMDTQLHKEFERKNLSGLITYSFLKLILPEQLINDMLDEISMLRTDGMFKYSKDNKYSDKKSLMDYMKEFSDQFTKNNVNLLIGSKDVAEAQMALFDYMNFIKEEYIK